MFTTRPTGPRIGRPLVNQVLLATIAVIALALVFGIPGVQSVLPYRIDLDVYRLGADALLSGRDLYGRLPDTQLGVNLPFTYPPIAAALFAPLAVVPYWAANLLLAAATVGSIVLVQHLMVRETGVGGRTTTLVAIAVALVLGPVIETVGYGQINALLMAMVVIDLFAGRGKPWRGWLVGLAMAIKLTPAVFLAYFLVRRDWRALAGAAASAALWTGLGFVVAPGASAQYWTSTIFDPSRIGGLAYVSNQSINGALARLFEAGGLPWFVLCAALGIACLIAMHRLVRRGESASAVVIIACYSLLASPVSWSHHWVWAAPALVVLIDRWRRTGAARFLVAATVGLGVNVTRIIWAMPQQNDAEQSWTWWQHILGNAESLWGLTTIAVLASVPLARRGQRSRAAIEPDHAAKP